MGTRSNLQLREKISETIPTIEECVARAQTLLLRQKSHIQASTLTSKYHLDEPANLTRFAEVVERAEADTTSIFTDLLEEKFEPEKAARKRNIQGLLKKTIELLRKEAEKIPGARWLVEIFGLRDPKNVETLARILEEVEQNPGVRLAEKLLKAFRPHDVPAARREVRLRLIKKIEGERH